MGSPPSATSRVTPTGNMLEDGFSCLITIAADTNIDFWEKTVTPAGYEGGEPIDITTMHNTNVVTKHPQSLYEVTAATSTVAYAREVLGQIRSIINTLTTITYTYPDGGTDTVFGYLRSFIPSALEKGGQPEATVTIEHTNLDPTDKTEQVPVTSSAVGTP